MPRGVKKVVVEELPEEEVEVVVEDTPEEVVEAPIPSRPNTPATGKWEKVRHEGKFYMASPEGQPVTGGTETENQIDDMVMKLNNKRR